MKDVSIIIADDHPLLLKGLYEELIANDYNVVGQASDGMNALKLILQYRPTLALIDIDMPFLSGFEVVKMAKEKGIPTNFIVLSFHKEVSYLCQAKALQINGYLLKEDSFFEIERCIHAVAKNQTYFSPSLDSLTLHSANDELKKLTLLTSSEVTILKLVAKQASNINIADHLCVSVRTVEKHRSNIIAKLALENSTNTLTHWAITNQKVIQEL
ncbi:response regulator transcription factor [Muricauda sp. SCSIO 64092]|uniref:response regulator n=1 Tax=Allomuricauda sp. SCSIO 64092 TaxID=2908842 RepID=UPI00131B8FC4|nr:response regulator transcription factor [Muricauda sp. SCSIO 64092]UOY05317.1 response regulator transcription factor [Muricauda sp. SCSIO 64092]